MKFVQGKRREHTLAGELKVYTDRGYGGHTPPQEMTVDELKSRGRWAKDFS